MTRIDDIQPSESEHTLEGIPHDTPPKRTVISRRVKIIAIVCALLLAGAGVYSLQKKQSSIRDDQLTDTEIVEETTISTLQDTELFFDPVEPVRSGSRVTFPIRIRTGANTVSAVELHIRYDPKHLTNVTIVPGTFFTNPTILDHAINSEDGSLSYVLGTLSPRQGEGVVATVSATVLSDESVSTSIEFDPQTQVAGIGERTSVVRETTNLTLSIGP